MLPSRLTARRLIRRLPLLLTIAALIGILVPLTFGAASVQAARPPLHSGSYAYLADHDVEHRLTASVQTARRDAPWVIVLHGGSWVHGSEKNVANAARLFESHGWQVFNVSYRLTGVTFADQTADLVAATRWIRAHAVQFGLDLHRGTVYGFSAGGHLAAWLGGTGWFRVVVSISGVLQPQRVSDDALGLRTATEPATATVSSLAEAEERIVGCPYLSLDPSCVAAWHDFEPQYRLHRDGPAVFLAQGQADPCVPPASADAFAYWLTRAGIAHRLVRVAGLGHTDQVLFGSRSRQEQMLRFVRNHSR